MTCCQTSDIDAPVAETRALQAVFKRFEATLECLARSRPANRLLQLRPCDMAMTELRMGRAPKIDSDAGLQAFTIASIDRMDFAEIAQDVAQNLRSSRRIGKSAFHDWLQCKRRAATTRDPLR